MKINFLYIMYNAILLGTTIFANLGMDHIRKNISRKIFCLHRYTCHTKMTDCTRYLCIDEKSSFRGYYR